MMTKLILGLKLTFVVALVALFAQLGINQMRAQENPEPCIEITPPDPITFEAVIRERSQILPEIKATYQWQETSPGVWSLFLDVSPFGGRERWVSTYPRLWPFLKPVDLPQSITINECPDPEPEPEYRWSEWGECSVSCGGGIQTRTCEEVFPTASRANSVVKADQARCEDDEEGGAQRACNTQACEEPTGTPVITPTPEVTTTPVPEVTATPAPEVTATPVPRHRWSGLGYNAKCDADDIEVTFDIKREDGSFEEKVKVHFEYQGSKQTAETNRDGRATVFFGKNGDGLLSATADGYPSQSAQMIMPRDCPETAEVGRGGQTLATVSYAPTGTATQSALLIAQGIGMLLLTAGSFHYVKTAKKA